MEQKITAVPASLRDAYWVAQVLLKDAQIAIQQGCIKQLEMPKLEADVTASIKAIQAVCNGQIIVKEGILSFIEEVEVTEK